VTMIWTEWGNKVWWLKVVGHLVPLDKGQC